MRLRQAQDRLLETNFWPGTEVRQADSLLCRSGVTAIRQSAANLQQTISHSRQNVRSTRQKRKYVVDREGKKKPEIKRPRAKSTKGGGWRRQPWHVGLPGNLPSLGVFDLLVGRLCSCTVSTSDN